MTAVAELPTRMRELREKFLATTAVLVEEVCRHGKESCRLWDAAWMEMLAGGDDPQARKVAHDGMRALLGLIDTVRGTLVGIEPDSPNATRLRSVRAQLRDRMVEAETGLRPEPEIDPAETQQALDDLAAGNLVPVEDVIRELQG
ncbi:MAG TPA: hypothetical protein VEL76_29765 [Gemmataceae bacterium]|nr:hypothetical protein [Gemmataceae bacterium]